MYKFILPLPPSVNHLYATNKNGARFMLQAGKDWMTLAGHYILSQQAPIETIKGNVSLFMVVRLLEGSDTSNLLKATEDLLKFPTYNSPHGMGVITDDSKIIRHELVKIPTNKKLEQSMYLEIEIDEHDNLQIYGDYLKSVDCKIS